MTHFSAHVSFPFVLLFLACVNATGLTGCASSFPVTHVARRDDRTPPKKEKYGNTYKSLSVRRLRRSWSLREEQENSGPLRSRNVPARGRENERQGLGKWPQLPGFSLTVKLLLSDKVQLLWGPCLLTELNTHPAANTIRVHLKGELYELNNWCVISPSRF